MNVDLRVLGREFSRLMESHRPCSVHGRGSWGEAWPVSSVAGPKACQLGTGGPLWSPDCFS